MTATRQATKLCHNCGTEFCSTAWMPIPCNAFSQQYRWTSNVLPAPEEIEYRREISDARVEILRYENELLRLARIMSKLDAERAAMETFIQQKESFLSPIRSMPNEILVIIFECAVDLDVACTTPSIREALSVHRISLVCSRWRDIVTSMPGLWSFISVSLGRHTQHDLIVSEALIRRHLELAGNELLTIRISSENYIPHAHYPFIVQLSHHAHRWKDVRVRLSTAGVAKFYEILNRPGVSLPNLEFLAIDYPANSYSREFRCNTFQEASKLREVHMSGSGSQIVKVHQHPLPFPQLEAITLGEGIHDGASVARLIAISENVDRLTIVTGPSPTYSPVSSDISTLEIVLAGDFGVRPLLNALTLPKLNTLVFRLAEFGSDSRGFDLDPVIDLVARSDCHLRQLVAKEVKVLDHQIDALLQHVPRLVIIS
ncbi:uncharacterized protein BT62DRAFT_921162 [Guyanagaster necrorhizus]|uniref:F-box domain-containing protein n=1 Tax=Guyanagaster necrorhizus TaxID=856835 RepID=A0A9P8AQS6_9AGAR|nr:uncharacterized protein BT62DRAFT_921162 [Guyanagaster necrorhizus MCA 3950]KAG7444320.1 hypothetical protein BT62DRAFT_921162 [Guyanagaster necrorhizus MCA 3950]